MSSLQDQIEIRPVAGAVNIQVRPPGSKSITNRALLCAAVGEGRSVLSGALDSEDTRVMVESLRRLGVSIELSHSGSVLKVDGCRGVFPNQAAELFVENSGTTIRFLAAALGVAGGEYRLDGIARMRERPIGPLIDALNLLGVNAAAESPDGCPPVSIHSKRVTQKETSIAGSVSSQYLSGLMMAAPLAENGLRLSVTGELVSRPYVQMTRAMMKDFGVDCQASENDVFSIAPNQKYIGTDYEIEPDASAASYFWGAAAICGGSATVEGLGRNALQGDVEFVSVLEQMGCRVDFESDSITVTGPAKTGVDVDMSHISDTVQTLAAVAMFVDGPTTVRGVAHNRVKETDRIGNLAIELRKFGATIREFEDGMTIEGPQEFQSPVLETYNDHRMAMSFAIAGLKCPGVVIRNPKCVGKTFPEFFQVLGRVTGNENSV